MNRKTNLVGGIILVLLGLIFLAREIAPQYFQFWDWPFFIIGLGLMFFIWALVSRSARRYPFRDWWDLLLPEYEW